MTTMTNTTEETRPRRTRRPNRRLTYLPNSIRAAVSDKMLSNLETEADAAGVSLGEVIRRCVDRGLPLETESRRRKERAERKRARAAAKDGLQ